MDVEIKGQLLGGAFGAFVLLAFFIPDRWAEIILIVLLPGVLIGLCALFGGILARIIMRHTTGDKR